MADFRMSSDKIIGRREMITGVTIKNVIEKTSLMSFNNVSS